MPQRRSKSSTSVPCAELSTVPFDRIARSPLNPRSEFSAKGIEDLASTIEQEGLLEALTVRPVRDRPGYFEIAAGERRFRALEVLRKRKRIPADWPVPVQVRDLDDRELLTLALVENLQREDLHPLDEGLAFKRLAATGVKIVEIARRLRRTRRFIHLRIQLTGLDPQVQRAFRAGEITLSQARILATAPPDRHVPAFETIRRYPAVFEDPKHLMTLLARDTFPEERAQFPPSRYKGPRIEDPDTGKVYYLDLPQVVRLQMEAAEHTREQLLSEEDIEEVEILQGEPSHVWTRYQRAEANPTHAAILLSPTGEISLYRQLVPASRHGSQEPVPAESLDDRPTGTLRAAAQRIRNAAFQEALAASPSAAVRVALVGLLQKPGRKDTGLAFGPSKPSPPAEPEAAFARQVAARIDTLAGSEAMPPATDAERPLDRIARPEQARQLLEALEEVPDNELPALLAAVVAARVGSPASPPDDAPLVAHLAAELKVVPSPELWLRPEYLEHYSKTGLIRLALESGAVPKDHARDIEDLTRLQIIDRILQSQTRDATFLPPELSFHTA